MAKPTKPADIDVTPEAKVLWTLEDQIGQLQGYLAITGDKQAADTLDKIAASVDLLHERAMAILTLLGVPIPVSDDPQPRTGGGK